jgi:dihydroceramidase
MVKRSGGKFGICPSSPLRCKTMNHVAMSVLSTSGYFINDSSNGGVGFWEPHTSSIDFCESNYLHTHLIVEPHNVWSSILGLSVVGSVGVLCGNPTHEWRTFLIYFILVIIGIGSACLHASLHWSFQSCDELPMVLLMICALYSVLEVDTPTGEQKYPHLPKYLVLLSCVATAVYFKYQHLYIIFFVTFSAMTVVIFCLHVQIAIRLRNENNDEKNTRNDDSRVYVNNTIALQFYALHHIAYTLIATPIWVLDQFHCGFLLPIYNSLPFLLRGMTLHVVWHLCSGIGAHCFIQFLCACRANMLGMACGTRRVFGVVPVVVIESEHINMATKKRG